MTRTSEDRVQTVARQPDLELESVPHRLDNIGPICAQWLLLILWSAGVAIPGVNETHYLAKARHWWDPSWCAGDFFLDSSNPHLVFYATFGAATRWLSLEQSAIVGRILALLIVAAGWQNLAKCLSGKRWLGFVSLPIFLALHAIGNFSGEWLVGGIESKVPAYGFLFWGLGELLSGRLLIAGLCVGLAVSFHPLVGLWGLIAMVMASVGLILVRRLKLTSWSDPDVVTFSRAQLTKIGFSLLICGVVSLPGLIPALQALGGASPEDSRIATRLQVLDRLSHHLDPMAFPKSAYWYLGSQLAIWLLLWRDLKATPQQRWWRAFVLSAVAIAACGVLVGFGERPMGRTAVDNLRLWLLKFYFFRLADIAVPVALSLAVAQMALNWIREHSERRFSIGLIFTAWLVTLSSAYLISFPDQNASRLKEPERSQWIAAFDWVRKNTPEDAVVYSTDVGWGVKWYTQRPEYVNYKDVPQDSLSVMEWNRRLWVIANWRIKAAKDGQITPEELADLRQQTGIRYLFTGRFGPILAEPVFSNNSVKVFELP